MSSKVALVVLVCVLAALITIEVVFWIFRVPGDVQAWILGTCGVGLVAYLAIMRLLQSRG